MKGYGHTLADNRLHIDICFLWFALRYTPNLFRLLEFMIDLRFIIGRPQHHSGGDNASSWNHGPSLWILG